MAGGGRGRSGGCYIGAHCGPRRGRLGHFLRSRRRSRCHPRVLNVLVGRGFDEREFPLELGFSGGETPAAPRPSFDDIGRHGPGALERREVLVGLAVVHHAQDPLVDVAKLRAENRLLFVLDVFVKGEADSFGDGHFFITTVTTGRLREPVDDYFEWGGERRVRDVEFHSDGGEFPFAREKAVGLHGVCSLTRFGLKELGKGGNRLDLRDGADGWRKGVEDGWGGNGEGAPDGRGEGVANDSGVGIDGFSKVRGERSGGVAVIAGVIAEAVIAG